MVTLSAFLLAITSEAANSLLQQGKDIKFSQVPKILGTTYMRNPN